MCSAGKIGVASAEGAVIANSPRVKPEDRLRDAAIQESHALAVLDCRASLAMTKNLSFNESKLRAKGVRVD
jgi:hypothetical protein